MYLTSVMLFSEQKFSHYLSVLFGPFLIALPLHFLWFWSCFWKWLCLERQHSEYSTKLCLCLRSHGYNNGTVMCFFLFLFFSSICCCEQLLLPFNQVASNHAPEDFMHVFGQCAIFAWSPNGKWSRRVGFNRLERRGETKRPIKELAASPSVSAVLESVVNHNIVEGTWPSNECYRLHWLAVRLLPWRCLYLLDI